MFAGAKGVCLNSAVVLHLCLIICCITAILADCDMLLPADFNLKPTLYKVVGTHRLRIDTTDVTILKMYPNKKIEAICNLNFKSPEDFQNYNTIYTKCENGYLYMSTDPDFKKNVNNIWSRKILECSFPQVDLYETTSNFKWCPTNVTSYNLVIQDLRNENKHPDVFLAGICFDIYTNSFNSIYYTLGPNRTEYMQPHIFEDSYGIGLKLEYIKETFGSNSISAIVFQNYQFIDWITDLKYDFHSIIQHSKLEKTYNDEFAALLEFMWWPNLRKNNWAFYTRALEKHIENDNKSYDILAGVSGAIKVPILQSCQKNYTLEEVIFDANKRIPQYIWNYLQDRSNNSHQLVIIGINSPLYEASQHDIIFCPDKCQEVSWLKEASSSFRFGIMGTIFCCSVEDVRFSRRLDGFPENDILSKPIVTTELPYEVDGEANEINDNSEDYSFNF